MDDERKVLWKKNIPTSKEAALSAIKEIGLPVADMQSAIEPVSGWGWYGEVLEEAGLKVHLVNVYKAKLISGTKLKNDKVDSKILAEMLRSDFLPTAYLAPRATRDLRAFIRGRSFLVRLRTRVRSRVHAILTKHGLLCPWTDLFGKQGLLWLKAQQLLSPHKEELLQLLAVYQELSANIDTSNRACAEALATSKEAQLLVTIPGVGPVTALMIVAEVGDFHRFPSPEKLACFAGLIPSSHSSGERDRFGHITHRGSVWLRSALVESTGKVSPKWGYLKTLYDTIKEKKGTNIARVALARKILMLSWHLVTKNQTWNAKGGGDSVKTETSHIS